MRSSVQHVCQSVVQSPADGNIIRRPSPGGALITSANGCPGQNDQFLQVAPVERQFQHTHVVDHLTDTGASRFHQCRIRLNLDRLGNLSHLQANVNDRVAANL